MRDWNEVLSHNITEASQLKEVMGLTDEQEAQLAAIADRYPLLIPLYYLGLIDWEHADTDPIRRLCIPSLEETDMSGSFDTSGEESNTKLKGLQHKYRQTALILSTSRCAMYCRHCFRKRLVGKEEQEEAASSFADIDAQFEYVKAHPEINNILISGGDAFVNSNQIIEYYLKKFSTLDSLQFIRFGTRVPVVFPMRIYEDEDLLDILEEYNEKKQIVIVTHFNHSREITRESRKAISELLAAGLVVRDQTVFLHGVNDDATALGDLLNDLTGMGVMPYSVFQCRPVTGVKAQFQVPFLKAVDIIDEAKSMVSGPAKGFRYAMSHPRGKIEILGKVAEDEVLFKFHQNKYPEDCAKIFTVKVGPNDAWLNDDLTEGEA